MPGVLAGCRIMIVEDNYFIAADLRAALRKEDAVVVGPVGQVGQAMDRIDEAERLDAAVLDVNLGDETTYPIADHLQALAIPWLFVTGYDAWSLPERYQAVPRITKPFATPAIIGVLASLTGRAVP